MDTGHIDKYHVNNKNLLKRTLPTVPVRYGRMVSPKFHVRDKKREFFILGEIIDFWENLKT
jgi:hypothetical protein